MKIYWLLILLPAVMVILGAAETEREDIGKITFPLGEVEITRDNGNLWQKALLNCVVYNTDQLKTGAESRCEVTLKDGSVLRIDENTHLYFADAKFAEERFQGSAKISGGKIWSNFQKLKEGDRAINVRTPTAVMAVRGTVFRANAEPDSSTKVLVYEGIVDVQLAEEVQQRVIPDSIRRTGPPEEIEGPREVHGPYEVTLEEWERIVAGMQINVRLDGKFHRFQFDLEEDAKIDWVIWNKERDQLVRR